MNAKAFGQNLKKIRKSNNISRRELADAANISVNSVADIELGRRLPSLPTFCNILDALDINADELLPKSIR